MLEDARLDGQIVDEGAVETFEVRDDEAVVLSFDPRMAARDGGIGDADIRSGLATDHERVYVDGEDGPF